MVTHSPTQRQLFKGPTGQQVVGGWPLSRPRPNPVSLPLHQVPSVLFLDDRKKRMELTLITLALRFTGLCEIQNLGAFGR